MWYNMEECHGHFTLILLTLWLFFLLWETLQFLYFCEIYCLASYHSSVSTTNFHFSAPKDQWFGHVIWVQPISCSQTKLCIWSWRHKEEWLEFTYSRGCSENAAPRPNGAFYSGRVSLRLFLLNRLFPYYFLVFHLFPKPDLWVCYQFLNS